MKIKCPLHIMYFTFVNPHYARCIVPLQYKPIQICTLSDRKTWRLWRRVFTYKILRQYHNYFIACLISQFFSSIIHTDFFLYVDSFLPFLQKQWKDCNVNVSRRQLAWLINIHSCRPNNPLVTTSSVSDLIISNVHVKDWEEKCSELNYLLNYSQKLSI